jgi:hypothetical protein
MLLGPRIGNSGTSPRRTRSFSFSYCPFKQHSAQRFDVARSRRVLGWASWQMAAMAKADLGRRHLERATAGPAARAAKPGDRALRNECWVQAPAPKSGSFSTPFRGQSTGRASSTRNPSLSSAVVPDR